MLSTRFLAGPWGTPPAPVVDITVQPRHGRAAYQGLALVDTGAGCCAIPRSFAEQRAWVPCRRTILKTPSGSVSALVYFVAVEAFASRWEVEAVASERPYAILGRDVLNELRLLLDGPKQQLEFAV